MAREEVRKKIRYYTIIDGSLRVQVDQNDPSAVRRDWKSADGKSSGTKWERIVNSIIGYIEDIQFYEGEYGTDINIALDKGDDGYVPVVQLKLASREGEDFLKKLPNINLLKEVKFRPFNFTDPSDGNEVRGMSVTQEDANGEFKKKITSFFQDADRKPINGYPVPEGDPENYSKDKWKIYFLQARVFLKDYTTENMCAKVAQAVIDRGVAVPQSAEQEERLTPAPTGKKSFKPDISNEPFVPNRAEGEVDPSELPPEGQA